MGDVKLIVTDSSSDITIDETPFVITLGTSGPQGAGGLQISDISYVFTQSSPANSWTIVHGLEFIPNITIVDSAGSVVEGDYSYPDENTVIATFVGAFAGKAYLS